METRAVSFSNTIQMLMIPGSAMRQAWGMSTSHHIGRTRSPIARAAST